MYRIRIIGDDVLRKVAKEITEFDESLHKLANEMLDIMHDSEGIGLAAPQVGVSKRLIVIDISETNKNFGPMIFVNPVILETKGEIKMEEGCLSVPGVHEDILRPQKITLKYQTLSGEEMTEEYDELMARVIQHEIDHINGILFVDYLSPVKRKLVLSNLQV
jgi:peptide deformylase